MAKKKITLKIILWGILEIFFTPPNFINWLIVFWIAGLLMIIINGSDAFDINFWLIAVILCLNMFINALNRASDTTKENIIKLNKKVK